MIETGFFFAFEGLDKLGKSTQIRLVHNILTKAGHDVITTFDPGSTEIGQKLREMVKFGKDLSPATELFIFEAARAQLIHEVIKPALEQDKIVLCDRFWDSTRAYQGYGRGWPQNFLETLHLICSNTPENFKNKVVDFYLVPDYVFLFKGEQFDILEKEDRLEGESEKFKKKVEEGYDKLSSSESFIVIDANCDKEEIAYTIANFILDFVEQNSD